MIGFLIAALALQVPVISDPTGTWSDSDGLIFVVTKFQSIYHPSTPQGRSQSPAEEEGEARVLLINNSLSPKDGELHCSLFHSGDVAMPIGDPIGFSLEPSEFVEVEWASILIQSASSMVCRVELTEPSQ